MGRDNPVRFIDAFVDGLDLAAAGFERATPKATGRPGYDPADLLKLYIYGLNRVRSSRRLEAGASVSRSDLAGAFVAGLQDDRRLINRAAFIPDQAMPRTADSGASWWQSTVSDPAVNSRRGTKPPRRRWPNAIRRRPTGKTHGGEVENIREKIAAIQGRRERFEEHRDALAASGEDQLSLTDPDSRAMHAATRVGVGYNIQIAVDAKHKLIAEQQVHSKVSDLGLLAETAVGPSELGRRSDRRDRRRGLSRSRISRPCRMPASCRMCPSPSADQR